MTKTGFAHKDILESLNKNLTLKEKLVCTHEAIKQFFPFLARIAITIYDPATTLLKSYIDSSDHPTQWEHCEAHLEELPSLKEVLEKGHPRVINNMVTFEDDEYGHIKRLGREGYAASYTMPFFGNGVFSGFIFFNSHKADVFDALTSVRSYKKAWSNDEAFAMLKKMAGEKLDRDCVNAIINSRKEVEEIQAQFKEDKFG